MIPRSRNLLNFLWHPPPFVVTNGENQYKKEHWVFLFVEQSLSWIIMTSEPPFIPCHSGFLCHHCHITANVRNTSSVCLCQKVEALFLPLLRLYPSCDHSLALVPWALETGQGVKVDLNTPLFSGFPFSLILGQETREEDGEMKRRKRDREGKEREIGIERGRKQETEKGSFYKNDYKQVRWPWVKASLQLSSLGSLK